MAGPRTSEDRIAAGPPLYLEYDLEGLMQLLRLAHQRPNSIQALPRGREQGPILVSQRCCYCFRSPTAVGGAARGRHGARTILYGHGQRAHGEVSDLVGEVAVDPILEGGVGEVAVVAKRYLGGSGGQERI